MYDLIIKNGMIVDGTASPTFRGDIAIKDGKIVRIARIIGEEAKEVIDAYGLTVTPGFIDSHSHSDRAIFTFSDMVEKIEQGITTSVGGQCGSTAAPLEKGRTAENSPEIEGFGNSYDIYKTFGSMLNAAKEIPLGSNLISFVGHGALRTATVGYENRKATDEELEEMKVLLREALENGAAGLSFGLIYTPSCYADTREIAELAKVVAEYGKVISAHIRDEGFALAKAVEEIIFVTKETGVRTVISHHKAMHKENWGKVNHTLRMIDEAVREGYDIYCDVYPYTASSTSLSATVIARELRDTDTEGVVKLVSDSKMREKIKEKYIEKYGDNLNNLQLTHCQGHPEFEGLKIGEIAQMRNQSHLDAALDVIRLCNGSVSLCNMAMCEEDVETVMKHSRVMIGTDSSVRGKLQTYHPRLRGTFPRVLGRYVRERKVTSLPEMIRKCTSMPAAVYSLRSKGILKEGYDADICIFDAEKIIDRATFKDCHERCEGLNYVILGGEVAVKDAVYNGKKNGKLILAD